MNNNPPFSFGGGAPLQPNTPSSENAPSLPHPPSTTTRLDDDRVASLDALGFVWSPPLAGGVPAGPPNANAVETRGIRPTKEVNDGGAMKQPASKVSSKKHSSSGSTTNSNKGIDKQKWWEGQITVEECVNQAAEAPHVAPPEEAHLDTNKNKLDPAPPVVVVAKHSARSGRKISLPGRFQEPPSPDLSGASVNLQQTKHRYHTVEAHNDAPQRGSTTVGKNTEHHMPPKKKMSSLIGGPSSTSSSLGHGDTSSPLQASASPSSPNPLPTQTPAPTPVILASQPRYKPGVRPRHLNSEYLLSKLPSTLASFQSSTPTSYSEGQTILYMNDKASHLATIVNVHEDAPRRYYTINFNGRERQTEASRFGLPHNLLRQTCKMFPNISVNLVLAGLQPHPFPPRQDVTKRDSICKVDGQKVYVDRFGSIWPVDLLVDITGNYRPPCQRRGFNYDQAVKSADSQNVKKFYQSLIKERYTRNAHGEIIFDLASLKDPTNGYVGTIKNGGKTFQVSWYDLADLELEGGVLIDCQRVGECVARAFRIRKILLEQYTAATAQKVRTNYYSLL